MNFRKLCPSFLISLSLAIVAILMAWNAFANVSASSPPKAVRLNKKVPTLRPTKKTPPDNNVTPGGGLSSFQVSCSQEDLPVRALVPVKNPVYTALSQPSFLFYIPDQSSDLRLGEFVLWSRDAKERIAKVRFRLPKAAPGIVRITLPESAASKFKTGAFYHWYLKLDCAESEDHRPEMHVDGWIFKLDSTSEYEQGVEQSDKGIWYDTIAQTFQHILDNPEDAEAQAQWHSLLKSIDAETLSNTPLSGSAVILQE